MSQERVTCFLCMPLSDPAHVPGPRRHFIKQGPVDAFKRNLCCFPGTGQVPEAQRR